MASLILTLAILTLSVLAFPANGSGPALNTVRLDSAFLMFDSIVLVSGYDTLYIDANTNEEDDFSKNNLGFLDFDDGSIIGAIWSTVGELNPAQAILFYAQDKGYYFNADSDGLRPFNYGWRRDFIYRFGAPDAAVRRNGATVFFKGCKMAVRHHYNQWDEETDVPAGLPCDIDAAWRSEKHDGIARLLKGNKVYFWYPNNTVSEAIDFDSLYTIHSWTLEPADE